jgi:hypothetical protein
MEVDSFVGNLRDARIEWTQDGFAALILAADWQHTGGKVTGPSERRTYATPCGWTWSVYSKAGAVYWSSVTLRRSRLVAPGVGDPGEASGFEADYATALATIRSVLGPEVFEGAWREVGPTGAWPLPDAARLAWWPVNTTPLCLALNAGEDHLRWLTLDLFRPDRFRCPAKQAEPGAAADGGAR